MTCSSLCSTINWGATNVRLSPHRTPFPYLPGAHVPIVLAPLGGLGTGYQLELVIGPELGTCTLVPFYTQGSPLLSITKVHC